MKKTRKPDRAPVSWWPGWGLERAIAGGVILGIALLLERCGWIGW